MISDYLQRNDITLQQFFERLDSDGDGKVNYSEFVDGVATIVVSGSLTKENLQQIFEAIDVNKDKFLTVNELSLFLQGAQLKRTQKLSRIDPHIIAEIKKEIETLFQFFDRGTGECTAVELHRTMQSISPISMEQASEMLKQVDKDNDGKITREEFIELMQPILLDDYVSPEQDLEDLRAIFRDADDDHSGYLTIEEMYRCLLKMGADITRESVISLFSEFDINSDMKIDIDEFVTIMSCGDQINFSQQQNVETYKKIRQCRKLDKLDFLKAFSKMPSSFMPSFYHERWTKARKNLPSSVFKV